METLKKIKFVEKPRRNQVPYQTSKMESFAKLFILNVCRGHGRPHEEYYCRNLLSLKF